MGRGIHFVDEGVAQRLGTEDSAIQSERNPPNHVLQTCYDLDEAVERNPQLLAQFDEKIADDELASSIPVGFARLVVFRWILVKDDAIVVHRLSK